jgi:ABC-type sugar transport system ATPase subunit
MGLEKRGVETLSGDAPALADAAPPFLLATREVSVEYPGTLAVDRVSVDVRPGEVLAIVGANGSGKTTLLSVLCGLRKPTRGTLEDATGEISFRSPGDALRKGITLVPQEPQLAVTLSCWENICLGHPSVYGSPLLDRAQRTRARRALRAALPHIDPSSRAGDLRKSDRAILALVAALARRPQLLALDEPTAVLGEQAVEVVSSAVTQVRENGGAVVLVSHRLRDIVALATRVVVLVDGVLMFENDNAGDLTVEALVEQLTHAHPPSVSPDSAAGPLISVPERSRPDAPLLRVAELSSVDGLRIDELRVDAGDIVGLAGLAGSGRSRLLRVLAGATRASHGMIEVDGVRVKGDVRSARRSGVAYVTEDRSADGVFAPLTVARNLTMSELVASKSLLGRASRTRERRLARTLIERFRIRTPHVYALITALSGGNQQRVVLGRALAGAPRVLLADEPTQGVDVGGRAEIQEHMREFARLGGAIVMSSSDFDELLSLCNRLVVMRDGTALGELDPERTDYRRLIALTSGVQVQLDDERVAT